MKAFTKTLAVVGMSFGAMGMANASPELTPADTAVTSKICVTAATGSKLKLRNALEDAGLTKHYVENTTNSELMIIEIQMGTYFGEDDIIRIDDPYSRNK